MKNKKIQFIVCGVVTLLLIATVGTAVAASAEGARLIELENKAADLSEQNKELNDEIVNSSSLMQIGKVAAASGLTQPDHFVYMNGTGVAMRGTEQVASLP